MRKRAGILLAAALGLTGVVSQAAYADPVRPVQPGERRTPSPSPSPTGGATPVARTVKVPSFDGTEIVVNFFPAKGLAAGQKAPTVLMGPGWGGAGERTGEAPTSDAAGVIGTGVLRAHGYNVVTWDPRGFGGSGGEANVNYVWKEGRDVSALVTWLTKQPEARLDHRGDPRVGMAGGSYGGGAQYVAAAIDRRIDAIVPSMAWNSLISSLYPDGAYKAGMGNMLCAAGSAGTNRVDAHVKSSCASGAATGLLSPEDQRWYAERGPGALVSRITAPTLILQGTVDTLFPLDEGVANYRRLRDAGTPVKMAWYCGGHGQCASNPGPRGHIEKLTLNWLSRHLKRENVATGPAFEYVDDTGVWRGLPYYPSRTRDLRASGEGELTVRPGDTSGNAGAARPAAKALNVEVKAPGRTGQLLGAPELRLTYKGKAAAGSPATTFLYAQLVDRRTGVVVGNQATPIPVRLDGRTHVVKRDLEMIAWSAGPDSRLTLQITPGTALYTPQRATADLTLRASVDLPLTTPGSPVS
ncbi:alpha/beta hydrolase family protein [Bailinhaonella thermotolerans]|nr:CocE/NonD family hydrolase [Bailinhaonella thermotolerans]